MSDGEFSIRVPDTMVEPVGWRAWNVVGSMRTPRLMSINQAGGAVVHLDALWPTNRWFVAKCPDGHEAGDGDDAIPHEGCSCGIYSARDRDHLVRLGYGDYGGGGVAGARLIVIGEVAYSGKVIPGSQGWKGQKARVKSLVVPFEHWKWVKPLGDAYRVPVELGFLFSDRKRGA
jgi:hypothetical protein